MKIFKSLFRFFISAILALLICKAASAQVTTPDIHVDVHPRPHPHAHIHVDDFEESLNVTEEETMNKTFSLPAGQRTLVVDNVWGFVHVAGGSADQVQLVAKQTIRADSKDDLELAKKDVTLDITQEGSTLKLYVNGPFRCQCDGCVSIHDHQGYIVKYDFELQVPREINLTARTVNDGDVTVKDVAGNLSARNVNGALEMTNVSGSVQAKTVNGELKVLFRENPQGTSSFSTVNGDVDLYFVPKLSVDMRFKTFNGEVFSDFQMSALPPRQPVSERQGAKFVFQADRYTGGRIAAGGPEIKVETLNGDIHIRERHD